MYEGWLSLGGVEVVNNERYAAYATALGLPTPREEVRCGGLPAVLDDTGYAVGGVAGAPWADAGVPEAAGFAGLYVTAISGFDAATSTREIVELAGDGGVPRAARRGPRTIAVTAFAAATSELALRYGLGWLDAVLHDDCDDPCEGVTLCALAACPTCEMGTEEEATDCWVGLARTLHDVVCVDGPRIVAHHDLSGSCSSEAVGATIEFTLVAAAPFVYRYPAPVGVGLTFAAPEPSDDCSVTWIPVGPGRDTCPVPGDECAAPVGCADDPLAEPFYTLPAPGSAGWCTARPESAWAAVTAPADLLPRWLDSVPVVTVTAGAADMRRLSLRFYANPTLTGITDPGQVDPCTAVAEVNVSYLARDSVLVLDGRTESAYVVCPGGGRAVADAVLSGAGGAAFEWPRLVCGSANLSVLALVDAAYYDPGASVDVELAARSDVA